MNILLMGCSYGVPNYFGYPGISPNLHIEHLLKNLGFSVHNCSQNGGSNLLTLQRAYDYISGNPIEKPAFPKEKYINQNNIVDFDWIIWFHTELFRDAKMLSKPSDYYSSLDYIANNTYAQYKTFFETQSLAKKFIIGGAGDLHSCFTDYIEPDICIKSLRQHICGIDNIEHNFCWNLNSEKIEIPKQVLENLDKVYNTWKKSSDYPDNGHPGERPHAELAEILLEQI